MREANSGDQVDAIRVLTQQRLGMLARTVKSTEEEERTRLPCLLAVKPPSAVSCGGGVAPPSRVDTWRICREGGMRCLASQNFPVLLSEVVRKRPVCPPEESSGARRP